MGRRSTAEPERSEPRITVRPAHCRDEQSVGEFLAGLSAASRYQRFFSAAPLFLESDRTRDMVTVTSRRFVLLGLAGETVIAHAMAACAGERTVEVGIVVAEGYRGRGVGNRLVNELAEAVFAAGFTEVSCDVLSENRPVLKWLRRLLTDFRFERSGETVTVHGRLVAASLRPVEERTKTDSRDVQAIATMVREGT